MARYRGTQHKILGIVREKISSWRAVVAYACSSSSPSTPSPSSTTITATHYTAILSISHITLTFGRRILILLIFTHQVVHVRLCFREFLQHIPSYNTHHPLSHTHHLVHAFTRVPMQESLATKHRRELFGDTLEQLLDCCAVTYITNTFIVTHPDQHSSYQ
jgi:hypothetical protein